MKEKMTKNKKDKISVFKCQDCKMQYTIILKPGQRISDGANRYCVMCDMFGKKNMKKKRKKTDE